MKLFNTKTRDRVQHHVRQDINVTSRFRRIQVVTFPNHGPIHCRIYLPQCIKEFWERCFEYVLISRIIIVHINRWRLMYFIVGFNFTSVRSFGRKAKVSLSMFNNSYTFIYTHYIALSITYTNRDVCLLTRMIIKMFNLMLMFIFLMSWMQVLNCNHGKLHNVNHFCYLSVANKPLRAELSWIYMAILYFLLSSLVGTYLF